MDVATLRTPGVCFLDTETTGLDADVHEVWEVGLIDQYGRSHLWYLPVNLATADPVALNIGRFHDRHPEGLGLRGPVTTMKPEASLQEFARDFARHTYGMHLCGAVVSFDEERLRKLLRRNGQREMWHYHLIDVEALMVGYLRGADFDLRVVSQLPWKSSDLSRAVGIEPPDEIERHTALGDARWAKRIYCKIMGLDQGAR